MSKLCSFFFTLYPTLWERERDYYMYDKEGKNERGRGRKGGREGKRERCNSDFVSAPSAEEWGLANSVEMYSVLLSQDTFLACCLALS